MPRELGCREGCGACEEFDRIWGIARLKWVSHFGAKMAEV